MSGSGSDQRISDERENKRSGSKTTSAVSNDSMYGYITEDQPVDGLSQDNLLSGTMGQNAVLHLQRTLGNAAVSRRLSGVRGNQQPVLDPLESEVPDYLESTFSAGDLSAVPHENVIRTFRQDHKPEMLRRYGEGLAEHRDTIAISKDAPLQRVRRMARPPKPEELPSPDQLPSNDQMASEVLTFFYPGFTQQMNDKLRDLAAQMLWEAMQGSSVMDYVPRPTGNPTFTWLILEGVKMAWRKSQPQGIYNAVRNVVAARHRTDYELAKEGI